MSSKLSDNDVRVVANPCPFCGSDDIWIWSEEAFDRLEMYTARIFCNGCGAELQSDLIRDREGNIVRSYEGAFENALEKWNRRA